MERHGRIQTALFGLAAALALGIAGTEMHDVIVYNPSPSLPQGFYIRSDREAEVGAIVTVRAVDVASAYARERDFIDINDRFIKRVAAARGDVICAEGRTITLNGNVIAVRVSHDGEGRLLPSWTGCRTLADEVLLLGDTGDSFDGRYWGPTPLSAIEGVWRRL